ncbi:hypothetical protein EJ03DRAFT_328380 [Teratosphaeria nubilosa]|uniref:Uncharacterized protein n=1 Tax=Teratosphaeria nubilosa TaxID=161662 RepID=A0A6G1L646_9PEZI|nr:hypothetical protein EJ03DRAFT_328380 [Teratosphaeria nubilosa]
MAACLSSARGVLESSNNLSARISNDSLDEDDTYVLLTTRSAGGEGEVSCNAATASTTGLSDQDTNAIERATRLDSPRQTREQVEIVELVQDLEKLKHFRNEVGLQRLHVQVERERFATDLSTQQASLQESIDHARQRDHTGLARGAERDVVLRSRTKLALDTNAWLRRRHILSVAEEKLRQLEQLQHAAEDHFAQACGRIAEQLVLPDTISKFQADGDYQRDANEAAESHPSLEAFYEAHGWANILQERLDQLDGEYGESLASSCIELPAGCAVSTMSTLSTPAYHAARDELQHELSQADREAVALEKVCFAEGLLETSLVQN